jgi:hypothetical protein
MNESSFQAKSVIGYWYFACELFFCQASLSAFTWSKITADPHLKDSVLDTKSGREE